MDRSQWKTERKGSLIILTLTICLIVIIVIAAICVGALTEGETRKIILMVLLGILILIGLGSFLFFEYRRKEAIKKRDRSAEMWLQQTLEEQRRTTRPSAPVLSDRTSWALTIPWKHEGTQRMATDNSNSTRTSLPPYSPPHSELQ